MTVRSSRTRHRPLAVGPILALLVAVLGMALLSPPARADNPIDPPDFSDSPWFTDSPGLSAAELAEVEEMMKDPIWQAIIDQWTRFPGLNPGQNPATAVFQMPLEDGGKMLGTGPITTISERTLRNLLDARRAAAIYGALKLQSRAELYLPWKNPELFEAMY